ncbi:MAG: dephospho-CoA kinase [Candidatus Scalindua sp. AMX11]|nr:MAG: dephospho-CoA kinase [Candidatus Scalindua sp.]NOG83199.1 dephospho-CoA kinase [Planctomycetota bacterium]RZV77564.1 MAG: dephospho-CoA kinase [Candidatus Scalindua sp. SCAELEC01]TDE64556.1 MAG: dephospho-CoA kinase [Candidatus Scalindua sp. AMX11]GJQ58631.1 MAG: dephospho-CoA kinase [Candidatus Scalindua sp.]
MKQTCRVIGITGGVASGKSTVAQMLVSLGAHIIDADSICHDLLEEREIKNLITERWGNKIEDEDGRISRQILGEIVFSDKRELLALNQIIHPRVIRRIKSEINELAVNGKTTLIVIDAALLVETNLIDLCDTILFVKTNRDNCEKRAQINRIWTLGEIEKRERFQGSVNDKMQNADFIIDNDFSKANTLKQVKDFWKQFKTNFQYGGKNGYNKN